MKAKSRFYFLTAVVFLTGCVAFFFRKNVFDAYGDYLPYGRLYLDPDRLHITNIQRLSNSRLELDFEGASIRPANRFEVYEKGIKIQDQVSPVLVLQPGEGEKEYQIKINSIDSCTIRVDMPEIGIPSLAVLPGSPQGPEEWRMYDTLSRDEAGAEIIRHYLNDSMKVAPDDPSGVRIKKIAGYILSITAGHYGHPAAEMEHLSPVGKLQCVQAGRSRLLCGDYSGIFSFFANKAGVPCRYIEAGRSIHGISYAPHVVTEVWLREYGCWAYTDLTDGIIQASKDGRLLNTIDIQRLLKYPMDSSVKALQYRKGDFVSVPYNTAAVSAIKAFDQNTIFIFYYSRYNRLARPGTIPDRLKSFLSFRSWYGMYSDSYAPVNYHFYFRVSVCYLFILAVLTWVITAVRRLQVFKVSRRR